MSYYKGSSYGGSRGGYRGGSSSYRGGGGGGNDSSWRGGRGGSSFSSSRTVSGSSGGGGGSSRYYPSSPPSYESRSRSSYVGGTSATDRYSSRRDESYNRYPEMSSYSSREYGRGSSPEPPRKRVRADSPSYIDLRSTPPNTKRNSSKEEQINTRKSKKPRMAGVDNEIHQISTYNLPSTNTTLTFPYQRKEFELNSLRENGHFVSLDNESEKPSYEISSCSSASNKEFKKNFVQGYSESVREGKYRPISVPFMNSLNANELCKIMSSVTPTEQVHSETSKKSLPENQRRMLEKLTNLMGYIHTEIDQTCVIDCNNSGDKVWCEELKSLVTQLESTVTKKIVQSSSASMTDPISHNEISASVSQRSTCLNLQDDSATDEPSIKSKDHFSSETNQIVNESLKHKVLGVGNKNNNLQEQYIEFLASLGDVLGNQAEVSEINYSKTSAKLSRADEPFELKSGSTLSDTCVQGSTEIIQSGTSKKRLPGAQIRRLKKLANLLGCTYEEIYKMCVIDCSNTGDKVWCEDLKNLVIELEGNTKKNNLSSSLDLQNDLANDVTLTKSSEKSSSKAKAYVNDSHKKDKLLNRVRNKRSKHFSKIPSQCSAKTDKILNKSTERNNISSSLDLQNDLASDVTLTKSSEKSSSKSKEYVNVNKPHKKDKHSNRVRNKRSKHFSKITSQCSAKTDKLLNKSTERNSISSSLDLQKDLANDVTLSKSSKKSSSKAKAYVNEPHKKDKLSNHVQNKRSKHVSKIPPQCSTKTDKILKKSSSEFLSESHVVSSNSVNIDTPDNVNFRSNTICSTQSNQLVEQSVLSTDLEQALAEFLKVILQFQENNGWLIQNLNQDGDAFTNIKCYDWEYYCNLQLKIGKLEKLWSDANIQFEVSANFTKYETTFTIFDFYGRPINLLQSLKDNSKLDFSGKDEKNKSVKFYNTLINFPDKDIDIDKNSILAAKELCTTKNSDSPKSERINDEVNNINISIKHLDGNKTVISKNACNNDSIVRKSTIVENAETVPVKNNTVDKKRRKRLRGSQKRRLKKLKKSRIQHETNCTNLMDCTNSNSVSFTGSTSNISSQRNDICLTYPEQQNGVSECLPRPSEQQNGVLECLPRPPEQQNGVLQCLSRPPLEQQNGVLECLTRPPPEQQSGVLQCLSRPPLEQQNGVLECLTRPPPEQQNGVLECLTRPPPEQQNRVLECLTRPPPEQQNGVLECLTRPPPQQQNGVLECLTRPPPEQLNRVLECLTRPPPEQQNGVLQCLTRPPPEQLNRVLECLTRPPPEQQNGVLQCLTRPPPEQQNGVLECLTRPPPEQQNGVLECLTRPPPEQQNGVLECLTRPPPEQQNGVLECLTRPPPEQQNGVLQCLTRPPPEQLNRVLECLTRPPPEQLNRVLECLPRPPEQQNGVFECLTQPEQQNRELTIIPTFNEVTNQIQSVQHVQNNWQNIVLTVLPTVNVTNQIQHIQHNQVSWQNSVLTVIPTVGIPNQIQNVQHDQITWQNNEYQQFFM